MDAGCVRVWRSVGGYTIQNSYPGGRSVLNFCLRRFFGLERTSFLVFGAFSDNEHGEQAKRHQRPRWCGS